MSLETVKHCVMRIEDIDDPAYAPRVQRDGNTYVIIEMYDTYREAKDLLDTSSKYKYEKLEWAWRYKCHL